MITATSRDTDEEGSSHKYTFDTVIVFGEGPVKPILLPAEVNPSQYRQLDLFNSDQLRYPEPDFWVMQHPRNLALLDELHRRKDISQPEKDAKKEVLLRSWQHTGWYSLKRMAKQNALAAGLALYKGITKEVILSGGRTMSMWVKKNLSQTRIADWPSEAELMAEVITSSYGILYEKKYGKSIQTAIKIEDASTNTLENFAYSVNRFPHLHAKNKKIGLISAGHHMKRLRLLSQIFGIALSDSSAIPSQKLLRDGETQNMPAIIDENNCYDTKRQFSREKRWIQALITPEYVSYWLGYVAEVKQQYVLQMAFERFRDEAWKKAGAVALAKVKIDIDEILKTDLETLATTEPQKHALLINSIKQLKQPSLRALPPEENVADFVASAL